MRYKGTNTIRFSCDKEKNVTVVIGDNVGGKTTIAQAFRFVLYGKVQLEKKQTLNDIVLLNREILLSMDSNSKASASVTLKILDDNVRDESGKHIENRIYILKRENRYTRRFPSEDLKLYDNKISLHYHNADSLEDTSIEIDEEQISTVINSLFPRDFSPYFLFDGEKWNDPAANQMDSNIKDSIKKLTGLTATHNAIYHLKDSGSKSALNFLKKHIKGEGAFFDSIQLQIDKLYTSIDNKSKDLVIMEQQIQYYQNLINEMEMELSQNSATEERQRRYKNLESMMASDKQAFTSSYKTLLMTFSQYGLYEFAKPMIEESLRILKKANLEHRDIPHIHQSTIDFLLERGTCICGCHLNEGESPYQTLMEQRNFLPPADIGTLLSGFEKTADIWNAKSNEFKEHMLEEAEDINRNITNYNRHTDEYDALSTKLDSDYNFAEARKNLKYYKEQLNHFTLQVGECRGSITSAKERITQLEAEKSRFERQSKENEHWRDCIDICKEIYSHFKAEFEEKERQVFSSLNNNIQSNFQQMFNAKDKKIVIDKDYNIQLLYKTHNGYTEEKNLSEGEKIARNFAFIISILEYNKGLSKAENDTADVLPLVLDGPFSKLSAENIQNISQVLPTIAEQVIVFTLAKDWEHTKLDNYIGAKYTIIREAGAISAAIKEESLCE